MADQPKTLKAAFPTPPPYYQQFTKANLKQLRTLQRDASSSNPDGATQLTTLTLPPELRTLLPPPPPPTQRYRTFNTEHDAHAPSPTLSSSQIPQLYPLNPTALQNPQPHLINLARSLLTTFLALAGTLAQDPTRHEEVSVEVQTLCYNLHDLVNRYRPHQARETLIRGMEDRVERLREETGMIGEKSQRVKETLEALRGSGLEQERMVGDGGRKGGEVDGVGGGLQDDRVKRQRRAWEAMERAAGEDVEMAGG